MEALLKALADLLSPYLTPTGGAVDTGDLSPQVIEVIEEKVGEEVKNLVAAGALEAEIESAVQDAIEGEDLLSSSDITDLIEEAGEGITEDGLLEAVRDALNQVV